MTGTAKARVSGMDEQRERLIAAATELHDREGCSCDRKYLMSCPNMANAILRSGPAVKALAEQEREP